MGNNYSRVKPNDHLKVIQLSPALWAQTQRLRFFCFFVSFPCVCVCMSCHVRGGLRKQGVHSLLSCCGSVILTQVISLERKTIITCGTISPALKLCSSGTIGPDWDSTSSLQSTWYWLLLTTPLWRRVRQVVNFHTLGTQCTNTELPMLLQLKPTTNSR